jgi:hypothetical protein
MTSKQGVMGNQEYFGEETLFVWRQTWYVGVFFQEDWRSVYEEK